MASSKAARVVERSSNPRSPFASSSNGSRANSGAAVRELVGNLRSLIRLRTENPPGSESAAARFITSRLAKAGIESKLYEASARRGSVVARLRGDGTAGGPLLLLSHLDTVPAEAASWTHPPFAARSVAGFIYGRGAADMKFMVALELQLMLEIARHATRYSADPRRDVIPGLRRDIVFAATADEESGGHKGLEWLAETHPAELAADAAINEAGGFSVEVLGRRFYPIQVGEKGKLTLRITISGVPGHGAMPKPDNGVVLMADIIERLVQLEPIRLTPLMSAAFDRIEMNLPPRVAGRLHRALTCNHLGRAPSSNWILRALQAATRDTFSPTIARSGMKYNVIPGAAVLEVDCRVLPGTTAEAIEQVICDRLGPTLRSKCRVDVIGRGPALEQPLDHPIVARMEAALHDHDPDGVPVRMMAPFSTDARHLHKLGVPTYGFSPLRFTHREPFLERFHADNERVEISALAFGLKVLRRLVELHCFG